jgi:uncharacterized protein
MRRRLIRIALILLFFPPLLAAVAGWLLGPTFLHPIRRELTPDLLREADASFAVTGATREDFDVHAPDGVLLKGWKVRPKNPNGNWVLLFHGVSDNRVGVIGQSEFLLKAGYSVLMMDARCHGQSGGALATYGWLERSDTRAIVDALLSSERPTYALRQMSVDTSLGLPSPARPASHIFALGESMGAGIVLQSAAVDPRIEAVVAEAPFANLREASYDYGGLRKSPWLGKTLFRPFTWMLLYRDETVAGFPVAEVSPEKAVAARAFPVLLICDEKDEALPCRHSQMIYNAAHGPKQLWVVPRAFHTAAYGFEPVEFRRRVLTFFSTYSTTPDTAHAQDCKMLSANPPGFDLYSYIPKKLDFTHLNRFPKVSYVIGEDGSVQDVKIVKGSGSERVDAGLVKSIRTWKYKPQPGCTFDTSMGIILDIGSN